MFMPAMSVSNIGFDYLCEDKVQDSNIFFHILQAQKDGIYNYFSREQKLIMSSLHEVKSRKIATIGYLRMIQTQINNLHFFLETNLASFKKALKAYDEKHGTETLEEELEELLSTLTFMDGSWTLNTISILNEKIRSCETGRNIKARGRRGSIGRISVLWKGKI